jgi:N-acetylmuramoyl-L-alanine amidase
MKNIIHKAGVALSIACTVAMVWIGVTASASSEPEIRTVEQYLQTVRPQQRPSLWTRMSVQDRRCLALNVYHEARGESVRGQMAVVAVTLNRVALNSYPDTVCGVVQQAVRDANGNPVRYQCQFSWYCDGRSDLPKDREAWDSVKAVTRLAVEQYGDEGIDITHGADHYHAHWVNPDWADETQITQVIGVHTFYDLR